MLFGLNLQKIRARLVRAPWSKTPEIKQEKPKPTTKKPTKPKHHWLSPSSGTGSTPTLRSQVSALDFDSSNEVDSVHDLQELDLSWSSRRKSSLNRISATNMTYVEEVRVPKHCKQYQYVPLFLDLGSNVPYDTSPISSEGIEMEMDTDIERRGSMPKLPRKPIPTQRIGTPPPLPSRDTGISALVKQRRMSFMSAVDEAVADNQKFEQQPKLSITRRLRPKPLDLSARSRSSDRVISPLYFTPGWIVPICSTPESISTYRTLSCRNSSSASRQSSFSSTGLSTLSSTDTRPIHILRPYTSKGVHCVLSDTPPEASWDVRICLDSPASIASGSTAASGGTAARWFAMARQARQWDA